MNSQYILPVVIILIIVLFLRFYPISVYITARIAGTPIPFLDLFSLRIKKIPVGYICNSYIMLHKAGLKIELKELETAYVQKHNLENITKGLIVSKQKNIPLTFDQAKEADKKGINIMEEIKNSGI